MFLGAYLSGLGLGLSLILAIGPQNTLVLRQGLLREHVFLVCIICSVSDALLILLGVLGFESISKLWPRAEFIIFLAGVLFLLGYGALAFKSAIYSTKTLKAATGSKDKIGGLVATTLSLTFLNPHVYLDTTIFLGSVASQYQEGRLIFGFGAMTASFVFFYSLGFGAKFLSPLFERANLWRFVDVFVGLTMWLIAIKMILSN
jgi:L-lysine exporter family protein LysE/ArgO